REAGVGREPLLAVDEPVFAVARGAGREHLRVGAALRLGHREARHDVPGEQRGQEALLRRRRAGVREDLRVARAGRLAPQDDRRARGAAEDRVQERELDLPVAEPAQLGTEMARPQVLPFYLGLERLDGAAGARARVERLAGSVEGEVERLDLLTHE